MELPGDQRSVETTGDVPTRFGDDDFYRALTAQPRRRLLAYLLTHKQCPIDELVDVLCGWESVTNTHVDADEKEMIQTELHHAHLPTLEDAGLLTYNRSDEMVTVESLEQPVKRLIWQSVQAEFQ